MSEPTVYRFFNNNTGVHFYTAREEEKSFIQNNLSSFSFEEASYRGVDPLTDAGVPLPVYRFLNRETGVHLYTISETERDAVKNSDSFTYEGYAFFAYETEVEGSIPIYRFFNSSSGAHFYTPSFSEKNYIEDNLPEFESEGIAYYALPEHNFSIEVVFAEDTAVFTPEMKTAINAAADNWENAILQSSFTEDHTLTIEVNGSDLGIDEDAFIATANFDYEYLELDANGNFLPTQGHSTVNTNARFISTFADVEYMTDVMTHEFGHIMGFGSLWQLNNLIDPITGVYYADTNAGEVYDLTSVNL